MKGKHGALIYIRFDRFSCLSSQCGCTAERPRPEYISNVVLGKSEMMFSSGFSLVTVAFPRFNSNFKISPNIFGCSGGRFWANDFYGEEHPKSLWKNSA